MPAKDPRIDAHIEQAQPFAKPILHHMRRPIADGERRNWKYDR